MKKKFEAKDWLDVKDEQPQWMADAANTNTNPYDDVEIVTRRIEDAGVDITVGYAAWRDVGFALSDAMGENGRSYYHRVSCLNPDYSAAETDKQYDKCLRSHGTGVTIKTFFQMAKDAGVSVSIPSLPSKPSFPSNGNARYPSTSQRVNEVSGVNEENEDVEEDDEALPTFSGTVAENLPEFLQKVVAKADSAEDGDILILGSLVVLSVCLPNVMGIYNKRPVWANLFLFVTAKASSGKGRLALCRYLIEPIHEALRKQNEAEYLEYKQKMQEYNCAKNKVGLEKPDEPPLRMLFIPANSSATAVYQVMNDNGGQGIMFETEGDTLANTFSSDYGNYSDGFRKAFHHESISYVRRKDREYVNLKRPRLSTLLTGTPKQILSLITDAENGLFSRFIFYYMNIRLNWQNVFDDELDGTLDDYFTKLGEEFNDFYVTLKATGDIRFRFTADQASAFNEWFEKSQLEYAARYGDEMIASIRRMGLITFRIAMILSALRIMENGRFEPVLICSDVDFGNAMEIAKVLVEHTAKVFRELPRAVASSGGVGQKTVKRQMFLDKLPAEFERKDFIEIATALGIPLKTAERNVKKWCDDGILVHVDQGKYAKR